jgi:hypothetical protein
MDDKHDIFPRIPAGFSPNDVDKPKEIRMLSLSDMLRVRDTADASWHVIWHLIA